MQTRRLLELVEAHAENSFALATAIAIEQKELAALIAEQQGSPAIAELIRASE